MQTRSGNFISDLQLPHSVVLQKGRNCHNLYADAERTEPQGKVCTSFLYLSFELYLPDIQVKAMSMADGGLKTASSWMTSSGPLTSKISGLHAANRAGLNGRQSLHGTGYINLWRCRTGRRRQKCAGWCRRSMAMRS